MYQSKKRAYYAFIFTMLMVTQSVEIAAASWKEQIQSWWNKQYQQMKTPWWTKYALIGGLGVVALVAVTYGLRQIKEEPKSAPAPEPGKGKKDSESAEKPEASASTSSPEPEQGSRQSAGESAAESLAKQEQKLKEQQQQQTLTDLRSLDETMANVYQFFIGLPEANYKKLLTLLVSKNVIEKDAQDPVSAAFQIVWFPDKKQLNKIFASNENNNLSLLAQCINLNDYLTVDKIQEALVKFRPITQHTRLNIGLKLIQIFNADKAFYTPYMKRKFERLNYDIFNSMLKEDSFVALLSAQKRTSLIEKFKAVQKALKDDEFSDMRYIQNIIDIVEDLSP